MNPSMHPLIAAALLALLFVGTHVGLATVPVRARLVARLGEWGFRWLFFAVAGVAFAALTVYYADHRAMGPAGPALGATPVVGAVLRMLSIIGVVLMTASFATYPGSPYDIERPRNAREPRGLERVTRHPFFVGLALFALAHALLATRLIASVLMLALALLAMGGSWHQDRKLLRLRGAAFSGYLASTSSMPFAAILAGRQRLVWRELPVAGIALGLVLAALLRSVHEAIFAYRGAWVVLAVVGGALGIAIMSLRRERGRTSSLRRETAR